MRVKGLRSVALWMAIIGLSHVTRAEDITLYWSGVIGSEDSYDTVYVYDFNFPPLPPEQTIVDVYGWMFDLFTYDSSAVNLLGDGHSNGGWIVDSINLYHSSTLNFSGGFWEGDGGYLTAHNSSTVNIYDGIAGFTSFAMVDMRDSSTANIYGGHVWAIIYGEDSSSFNIYGGDLSCLGVYGTSTANIFGGDIGSGWGFELHSSALVNIYGYSFTYDPEAEWRYWEDPNDGWWVSRLTGYGCHGTSISIWGIPDPCTHSNINLIPDFVLPRGVDFGDFAVLATAWRSSPGDGSWNPICDISDPNDDVIDERDLDVLTTYWLAGVK